MKYKDWLNQWLLLYVKPSAKKRTYDKHNRTIANYITPVLGDIEITELTSICLQKFVVSLSERLAPSTVNGIISVIKCSLKAAVIANIAPTNIADGIQRPKYKEKKVECFSLQEQKAMESYILKNKLIRLYGIIITLYTGLRIGELLALKWSDIEFKSGKVFVTATCSDSWQNGKYVKLLDEPKTKNSHRTIPLPKALLYILREIKKQSASEFVVDGRTDYGAEIRSYQKSFERLLKRLNIPHKGFHALRHTFATRALECGMDVKTLSEILGHKNAVITLNRYVHSLDEHKINMMNRVGKLLE